MTTKRPYNSPKNFKDAVEELLGMPDHYDMRAVRALKKLVDSGEIYKICSNNVNIISSEEEEGKQ